MSSTELVKSMYEAFGRGDIPYILGCVAPDCRWVVSGQTLPQSGVYSGPEGAADFFRKLDEAEEVTRFEPKEYFESGDKVVALGFEETRSRKTGKAAATNWAMVFRVREEQVTYFEIFFDTEAQALSHQADIGRSAGGN